MAAHLEMLDQPTVAAVAAVLVQLAAMQLVHRLTLVMAVMALPQA
jgi:hypothetical protein